MSSSCRSLIRTLANGTLDDRGTEQRGGTDMPVKVKVLLVDDETEFADNMVSLLETRGFSARAVYDGESALRVLEDDDYDVMVLDLKMPGMDGITTLRRTNELGLHTQVLILTGHGSVDTALEAIRIGAYDYLAKPCEIDELVEKIEGARDTKTQSERLALEDRVKRAAESPRAAMSFFKRNKR